MSTYPQSVVLPGAIPGANAGDVSADGMARGASAIGILPRVHPLAALLLPSLGAVIFLAVLFNVLLLSGGVRTLFRDADTGWHVRTGERMIQLGSVPAADDYSLLHAGRPWYAWEWLSDVALGEAHLLAGPAGVALLAALVIAFSAWVAWRLALSLGANVFAALAMLVPMLGTTSIHWLARPHLFSWLLGLAFVAIAERFRRRQCSARELVLLPMLSCLWANTHGSFLLGTALLLIYAVGEWLAFRPASVAGRNFALAALASLLATFANPYGWRLHEHVFAYLRNDYLMDHISEFRSFNFHAPGALYVEGFLLLAAVGTLRLLQQRAYGPALLALALGHMALYSARHLPTFAVMMSPLFAAALSQRWDRHPLLDRLSRYSSRLLAMEKQVSGVAASALGLLVLLLTLRGQAQAGAVGFDPQKFPVAASQFLATENVAGRRVFARDYWGGYLIYRFDGRLKVFVDGRSDFYGEQWLESYAQINEVKPGWDRLLDGYQLDTVLVPPAHPLASALSLHPAWRLAYSDAVAVVFERRQPEAGRE